MKKLLALALVLLAVLSAIIAVIYFTKSAGNLPHFFLGYIKGSNHKHTKHAVAFLALAVVLLIGAWMVSGKKPEKASSEKNEESN